MRRTSRSSSSTLRPRRPAITRRRKWRWSVTARQSSGSSTRRRQWFYPKDTPWRQIITQKAAENAAQIRPQIHDDEAPANYFRALRDVAAWMPKNAILSAEGAGTMDI